MLYIRQSKNHHEMTKLGALPLVHVITIIICRSAHCAAFLKYNNRVYNELNCGIIIYGGPTFGRIICYEGLVLGLET